MQIPEPVYVVLREDQSNLGYIDTDVQGVYWTEADAETAVKALQDAELVPDEDGCNRRVHGRENEWLPNEGVDESDWTVSFHHVMTTIELPHEDDECYTCPNCGDVMLAWQRTAHSCGRLDRNQNNIPGSAAEL